MSLLGTIPASATGSFETTFLPQFISFSTAIEPDLVQVTVLGDGTLLNLNTAGAVIMNKINTVGDVANQYIYELGNGLIRNKNVTVTITNATASPIEVFGFSPNGTGSVYTVYEQATALASSGIDITDFVSLGVANSAAGDIYNITYQDGTIDNLSINELQQYLPYFQGFQPTTAGVLINNSELQYSKVNIIPAAQRTIYKAKFMAVGNIENTLEN